MMNLEEHVMVLISDFASQTRGKGFPAIDLQARTASGVNLALTNLMITAFGEIHSTPWGPRDELLMMPDPGTEVSIRTDPELPPERFVIADIHNLDGSAWECCPRSWLSAGLAALELETGLQLLSAFEHEFHYSGADDLTGDAYLLDSVRSQQPFGNALMASMRENGISPESFLPEYGAKQFEITCSPKLGVQAADEAVSVRAIARATARSLGERVSFSPMMAEDSVGNGVHVHFSLWDRNNRPTSYDAGAPHHISAVTGSFLAGILRDMPAIVALTAPSAASYDRLIPDRWSATYNNLGELDREAGVRVCAVPDLPAYEPAETMNFEYRTADAAASPYLVLGALVWAGVFGIRDGLKTPDPTESDPNKMTASQRSDRGLVRLPTSLDAALEALEGNQRMRSAMGEEFLNAYLMHKRSELAQLEGLSSAEQIAKYVAAY